MYVGGGRKKGMGMGKPNQEWDSILTHNHGGHIVLYNIIITLKKAIFMRAEFTKLGAASEWIKLDWGPVELLTSIFG